MKRRQFIGMAAAGAAGLAWPVAARDGEHLRLTTLAHPHLLDVLRDERVVCDLGRRYRKSVPAENSAHALAQAILADPPATATTRLNARVNHQVQRDFAEGRTVTLNGWVLSVTEARQCALYSLLQS
jgi:hypothetical protein